MAEIQDAVDLWKVPAEAARQLGLAQPLFTHGPVEPDLRHAESGERDRRPAAGRRAAEGDGMSFRSATSAMMALSIASTTRASASSRSSPKLWAPGISGAIAVTVPLSSSTRSTG